MSKGIKPPSSPLKVLLQPEGLLHTRGMAQACAHCAIFPTAASRRSLDRVSVPVWLVILRPARDRRLGEPLPNNKLIPSGHIRWQEARGSLFGLATLCGISYRFQ